MLIEWFIAMTAAVVEWAVSGLPKDSPEPWFVNFDNTVNTMYSTVAGLGAWVDLDVARVVLIGVTTMWAVFFGIKLFRVGLGHVPSVGGNG